MMTRSSLTIGLLLMVLGVKKLLGVPNDEVLFMKPAEDCGGVGVADSKALRIFTSHNIVAES
jgi:hypothetical protein